MKQISFNVPLVTGREFYYIAKLLVRMKFCGDAEFTKLCNTWLEKITGTKKALLTTSCTHALEMSALLLNIKPGDEVIMPSYTFVSTANAFVLRGAVPVFVDIRPDTMNIDETLIEQAITPRTRAIVPVHYAGVACEMETIVNIANQYKIEIVEDAAQAMMSQYQGKSLGVFGIFGCYSFHETKNYQCGEGGALLINCKDFAEKAEILREKGTDRAKFYRGEIDKYSWVDLGSSYLPSDLNAAFLYAQFEIAAEINNKRLKLWKKYFDQLSDLANNGLIELPVIPLNCTHNGHMFFIKVANIEERQKLILFLKERSIQTTFHYIPLHSTQAGRKFGRFSGNDRFTTNESERLLRLPMHLDLTDEDIDCVVQSIRDFFKV